MKSLLSYTYTDHLLIFNSKWNFKYSAYIYFVMRIVCFIATNYYYCSRLRVAVYNLTLCIHKIVAAICTLNSEPTGKITRAAPYVHDPEMRQISKDVKRDHI